MKRRNFLAFIPAFGAVPFVGVDILKSDDKIEIIKPKLVKVIKPTMFDFEIERCRIQLVQDGIIIGEGMLEQLDIDQGWIESIRTLGKRYRATRAIYVSGQLTSLYKW